MQIFQYPKEKYQFHKWNTNIYYQISSNTEPSNEGS